MSVIPLDEPPGTTSGTGKPGSFWKRLAQALDAYLVERTKQAVPEIAWRRSKRDIHRFRRLMQKSALAPVAAGINSAPRRRVTET